MKSESEINGKKDCVRERVHAPTAFSTFSTVSRTVPVDHTAQDILQTREYRNSGPVSVFVFHRVTLHEKEEDCPQHPLQISKQTNK